MAGNSKKTPLEVESNLSSGSMLSEINVTPFVDVMLVLLIIFMVSAPLMQQGIQVDLPKTKSPPLSEQEKPIVLVVKRPAFVEINNNEIPLTELTEKLKAIYAKRERKEIFIHASHNLPYGVVANVMAQTQQAGITRIGLVTNPKEK